jgi:hypothetical protein
VSSLKSFTAAIKFLLVSLKVLLPDDWVRWEWFDTDNIPNNLFPPTKNLIESYLGHKVNVAE